MRSLVYLTKKVDNFASPEVEGTLFGGIISIVCYVSVLVLLVVYCVNAAEAEYPTSTSVAVFPNEAAEAMKFAPMNCVATNGCYIKAQMGTREVSGNEKVDQCLYLAQGEALPDDFRYLYYNSDPTEFFSVLSKDNGENFALSYDVSKVTAYGAALTVSKLAAATDFSLATPMPYKIYRGISVLNVISTVGLDQSVDTWTNTVVSETSTFGGTGGCCGATFYDAAGNDRGVLMSTSDCTANQNTWWTTKLVPPTTYAEITVVDPLDVITVFGLVGGWLGIIISLGATGFWLYDEYQLICGSDEQEEATPKTIAADEEQLELASSNTK